jgi:hypothetical protein
MRGLGSAWRSRFEAVFGHPEQRVSWLSTHRNELGHAGRASFRPPGRASSEEERESEFQVPLFGEIPIKSTCAIGADRKPETQFFRAASGISMKKSKVYVCGHPLISGCLSLCRKLTTEGGAPFRLAPAEHCLHTSKKVLLIRFTAFDDE